MSANQHKLKQQLASLGISMEEWRQEIYPDFKSGEKQVLLHKDKVETPEQDHNVDIGGFEI